MKKWKKYLLWVSSTLLIGVIVLISGVIYLFHDTCINKVHATSFSPRGAKFKAVIFQRDCGATTSYSTQVSILETNKKLENKSGNIMSLNSSPNQTNIKVTWINERELSIKKQYKFNAYKQKYTWGWPWNEIEVVYQ